MSQTLITSRDPKGLQIANLFDVTLNKAYLDHERAQRLIENGGEFQEGLAQLIERCSAISKFAEEEVESSYGYLSGYRSPKPIDQQVKLLNTFFSNLGNVNKKLTRTCLPDGSEGLFAIPRWQRVAQTYESALLRAFECLRETRRGKFTNCQEGILSSNFLRLTAKTAKAFEEVAAQQLGTEHHILILPCQLGLRHRGRSVRRAREVMSASEFGLDPFSTACILLTHPDRLQHFDDLWIDCAGAEYSYQRGGSFDLTVSFDFDGSKVEFEASSSRYPSDAYGSASGFVQQ